jgi:hypothetical protein
MPPSHGRYGGDQPSHLRLRIPKGYSSIGNAPAAHELDPMTLSNRQAPAIAKLVGASKVITAAA